MSASIRVPGTVPFEPQSLSGLTCFFTAQSSSLSAKGHQGRVSILGQMWGIREIQPDLVSTIVPRAPEMLALMDDLWTEPP